MPKQKVITMTQDAVDHMRLTAPNIVLVHIVEKNIDRKTASGIITIAETETTWNPSMHEDRVGVIVQLPSALKRKKDHLWKTKVEVKVGDKCWFDPMTAANTDVILTETETYYLLDYFDCHVVRRGDEVIMLNGYALFTQVSDTSLSPLAIDFGKLDARYGICAFKGTTNDYYFEGLSDDTRIEIGDKCVFKMPPVLLEGQYHNCFDGDKDYRISHLHNVVGFIRDEKLHACVNHIAIEPEIPSHRPSGLEIPEPYRKATGNGVVYDSGYHEVVKGDEIRYPVGSAVKIEFSGKVIHLIHFSYVHFIKQ